MSEINHLLPLPDEEGIRKTKEFYKEKHRREITDEQTMYMLGRVMRHLYAVSQLPTGESTGHDQAGILAGPEPVGEAGRRRVREREGAYGRHEWPEAGKDAPRDGFMQPPAA